jgi:hypothetical protein
VEARKALLFQNDNMSTFLGEQGRNGGPGGSAADNDHIALSIIYHAGGSPMTRLYGDAALCLHYGKLLLPCVLGPKEVGSRRHVRQKRTRPAGREHPEDATISAKVWWRSPDNANIRLIKIAPREAEFWDAAFHSLEESHRATPANTRR